MASRERPSEKRPDRRGNFRGTANPPGAGELAPEQVEPRLPFIGRFDPSPPAPRLRPRPSRVVGQPRDRVGDRGRVAGGDDRATLAVGHDLGDAANVGGDHRALLGKRLHHHQGRHVGALTGAEEQHVVLGQQRRHVAHRPGEGNVREHGGGVGDRPHPLRVSLVEDRSDDAQARVQPPLAQQGERLNGAVLALAVAGGETAHHADAQRPAEAGRPALAGANLDPIRYADDAGSPPSLELLRDARRDRDHDVRAAPLHAKGGRTAAGGWPLARVGKGGHPGQPRRQDRRKLDRAAGQHGVDPVAANRPGQPQSSDAAARHLHGPAQRRARPDRQ